MANYKTHEQIRAEQKMGKHGRLHEQEAERAKGVTFGEPHPPTAPKTERIAAGIETPPKPHPKPEDAARTAEREARVAQAAKEDADRATAKAEAEDRAKSAKVQADAAEEAKAWATPTAISLGDVHAVLADTYPGYEPRAPLANSKGLTITLPGEKTITIERKCVKSCANMEELRAYIDSVK